MFPSLELLSLAQAHFPLTNPNIDEEKMLFVAAKFGFASDSLEDGGGCWAIAAESAKDVLARVGSSGDPLMLKLGLWSRKGRSEG